MSAGANPVGAGAKPAGADGPKRLPRIVRINYTIRAASFAYCFLVVGLLFWERRIGPVYWVLLALQFLIYPQLAWLRARRSSDPRRAELQNMQFDAIFIGAWVAVVDFPLWITFGGLFAVTLNSAVMRGGRGVAAAVVGFCLGAVLWVAPMGFAPYAQTSHLVSTLCFVGALAYAWALGVVAYAQNQRLREARDALRKAGERPQEPSIGD